MKREASSQLVDNVLEGCAFAGQSPRQRSRAHGQFLRNIVPLRFAVRQQLLRLVFNQSAQAARRRFALLGRLIANGAKSVQQVHVFRNERHSEALTGEDEFIRRPAKFDRTAAESLKLRKARAAHVDKGYFCRVNIPACDLAQTLHDNRDSKLSVLPRPKPRYADEVKLDHEVTVLSRQFYTNGFVYDPEITRKQLYRLANILRCGGYVEQQSHPSGIYLCTDVETECRIVQRLSSGFKEPGLRGGGDANLVCIHSLFGQAKTL